MSLWFDGLTMRRISRWGSGLSVLGTRCTRHTNMQKIMNIQETVGDVRNGDVTLLPRNFDKEDRIARRGGTKCIEMY